MQRRKLVMYNDVSLVYAHKLYGHLMYVFIVKFINTSVSTDTPANYFYFVYRCTIL
jgi:hypothetical protein